MGLIIGGGGGRGPKGMLAPPLKLLGGGLGPHGLHSSYAYVKCCNNLCQMPLINTIQMNGHTYGGISSTIFASVFNRGQLSKEFAPQPLKERICSSALKGKNLLL